MNVSIIAGRYYHSKDGIGRYTTTLVKELKLLDKNLQLNVISDTFQSPSINSKKNPITPFIPDIIKSYINPIKNEFHYYSRFRNNKFSMLNELKDINSQVYHAISPSESIMPIKLYKKPLITTFHDIIPLVSESRYKFEKYYFNTYSSYAKKSQLLLAVSTKTKEDLINVLGISENKILVIYPGIDTNKFYPLQRKSSNTKIILFLGGLTKRKGIYETIYAFNKLAKKRNDVRLIIGGDGDEFFKLNQIIHKLNLNKFVHFLGFIDERQLLSYYHRADLFVYPSKYEGFGFTPLEAMASGVPVITSSSSSLSEIVGDAAIKVDPYDINEICLQMNKILDNNNLQNILIKKGINQSRKFSWKRCAKETLDAYKSVL